MPLKNNTENNPGKTAQLTLVVNPSVEMKQPKRSNIKQCTHQKSQQSK